MDFKMKLEDDDYTPSEEESLAGGSSSMNYSDSSNTIFTPYSGGSGNESGSDNSNTSESSSDYEDDMFAPYKEEDPVIISSNNQTATSFLFDQDAINIFTIIGSVLMIIAMFIPYIYLTLQPSMMNSLLSELTGEEVPQELSYVSSTLIGSDGASFAGIVLLLVSIASIVFACLRMNKLMKIMAGAVAILVIRLMYRYLVVGGIAVGVVATKAGPGFYLMLIAAVIMIAAAIYKDFFFKKSM